VRSIDIAMALAISLLRAPHELDAMPLLYALGFLLVLLLLLLAFWPIATSS
jgi:hypothetical protein